MAVKSALTYSWPSGLARLRQFATTICAPSNLSRKSIALDLTERVVISVMFSHFAFRSLRSFTQSSDIETLLLLFSGSAIFVYLAANAIGHTFRQTTGLVLRFRRNNRSSPDHAGDG